MFTLKRLSQLTLAAALCAFIGAPATAELPDPDGEYADETKPVQVFIIMGQSNTLEYGQVGGNKTGNLTTAVKEKGMYPYLIDDEGNWTTRKDVRNVSVMHKRGNMNVYRNAWLSVEGRNKIGIETAIGYHLGHAIDAPVMLLKSSIGNRALGWDLLPPGSERFEIDINGTTYVYPGYKDEVRHGKWVKGQVPDPPKHGWYAGKQWDDDTNNALRILSEIEKYYPGAQSGKYEVKGFLWWQGDRDMRDAGHAARYEQNLLTLHKALKETFNAPDAPLVIATLGQTAKDAGGNQGVMLQGMMNVDGDSGKYPQNKGMVKTVYTHPVAQGQGSSGHYGGNAEVYMDVGEMMGKAMVELLEAKK